MSVEPTHQSGTNVKGEHRIVVDHVDDETPVIDYASPGIGLVTLCCDSPVPVMVWGCLVLLL